MTPLQCADQITLFLKKVFHDYECMADYKCNGKSFRKTVNIYTGYLPIYQTMQEKAAICPAIVTRPFTISDEEDETTCSMSIFITTMDNDKEKGCFGLFHLMQLVRYKLLSDSPINRKYIIKNGTMESIFPDEQPYPQWIGRINFQVNLPQPQAVNLNDYL